VVVLGGPGMGKTTLTRAVATHPDVTARFAERRWFVPLETAADAASLRTEVVLALRGNPTDPAAFDQALAALGLAPALLVLDNLETPYDADTTAVRDTLRRLVGVPSLTLLCSYRGHTAPAAPAFPHQPVVPPLPDDAARRLFLELAPRIRPADPHLAPFLRDLGGVPLAIELVALRAAPHDTLAELWDDWQRRGVELAKDPDLPEGRLTSLPRSIDLSWRSTRLHEEGRGLFRMLGALPAGMAREDRAALLGDDATEAARQLLAIGLAVASEGRLDLLPPVRDAARRLAPATAAETDRWCRRYLGLLTELGPQIGRGGGSGPAARLAPELANLDAAVRAGLAPEHLAIAVGAARGLAQFQRFTGLGTLAVLSELAAACERSGDAAGEARCRWGLGTVALHRSQHDAARSALDRALQLYRQAADVQGEAQCVEWLGNVALRRSQHDAARAAYEQALPLYRQVGDVGGEANCIQSLGDIALERSQHDAARAAYEQALPLYRQVGDVLGEANCIKSLGDIALQRSQHDAARAAYAQALPLYRQVGDVLGEANCILSLGNIAREQGDVAAAREHYATALAQYARIPEPYSIGWTHFQVAELADGAERAAHVAAAREAWTSIDRPDLVARLDRFG